MSGRAVATGVGNAIVPWRNGAGFQPPRAFGLLGGSERQGVGGGQGVVYQSVAVAVGARDEPTTTVTGSSVTARRVPVPRPVADDARFGGGGTPRSVCLVAVNIMLHRRTVFARSTRADESRMIWHVLAAVVIVTHLILLRTYLPVCLPKSCAILLWFALCMQPWLWLQVENHHVRIVPIKSSDVRLVFLAFDRLKIKSYPFLILFILPVERIQFWPLFTKFGRLGFC